MLFPVVAFPLLGGGVGGGTGQRVAPPPKLTRGFGVRVTPLSPKMGVLSPKSWFWGENEQKQCKNVVVVVGSGLPQPRGWLLVGPGQAPPALALGGWDLPSTPPRGDLPPWGASVLFGVPLYVFNPPPVVFEWLHHNVGVLRAVGSVFPSVCPPKMEG